jgi:hypothetical protein
MTGPAHKSSTIRQTSVMRVDIAYEPERDGEPDSGEVVWAWVPFEEDPSQGKDRPIVVIGHAGTLLVGVMLTSKPHPEEHRQVLLGAGAWDSRGRTSYARLDRLIGVSESGVRREGAALDRERFDRLVAALKQLPNWPEAEVEVVT